MLDWLCLLLRRPCVQLQTWLFIPFNILIVFLKVSNWWSSCLVSSLLDNSSHFSWAIVCSSAPQLRYSTFVTKTERYCCWTDWVFFWEDHAFSYKLGCLIPSNLSLMFFYRLVFDGAVFFRAVLLLVHRSPPFFGGAIIMCSSAPQLRCSTVVIETAILLLDWLGLLLRRPCVQLQTWLFIPFNILIVFLKVSNWWSSCLVSSCLVSYLLDNSSHFSWAIVCSSAPQLRYSTFVTKTERYCCWTDWVFFWEDHAFSYKLGCLIPSNLSLMFFLQVSIWRSCFLPGRFASCSQIAAFFWGAIIMCSSAPQLRCSTVVIETAILLLDWLGLLLRRPCVQLQTWLFDPFNFAIFFAS